MGGNKPLVVLAAGGTAGHVFPAEALAIELAARDFGLTLFTDQRGGAFSGVLQELDTYRIRAGGIKSKNIPTLFKSGFELAIGLFQAHNLLRKVKPCAVVGFGGYASVPTMLAASLGAYPTLIHEQNAVLGRANRFLASRVNSIATCFEAVEGLPGSLVGKVTMSGMPVRPSIVDFQNKDYRPITDDGPFHILVIGGSQGARVLSDVVPASITTIPEAIRRRFRIVQQCRHEDMERVRAAYVGAGVDAELATFFDDLPKRLAEAHLVIARAGASTVAEVTTIGRPSILVPYSFAIDDHQARNAHAINEAGAGWVLPESGFSAEKLRERLESLIALPSVLELTAANAKALGRPGAVKSLADMVLSLIRSTANGYRRAA